MGNCCSRPRRQSLKLSTPDQDDDLYLISDFCSFMDDTPVDDLDEPEYYESTSKMPGRGRPLWVPSTPHSSASFIVTNKASTIEWKGYGLKFHVLDDSIPHYLAKPARLDVSFHGFKNRDSLPLSVDDQYHHTYHPISALYSVKVGSGKLCKPVTIEIQHCFSVYSDSPRLRMDILRAASEDEYFKPIEDAVFDQRTNYGRVTVPCNDKNQEYDDFSWFIIALRQFLLPGTIHYTAQVYISKTTMKMHFIITMAIDPCTTVVETKYDATYDLETSFSVEFDDVSKRISLDVSELKSGWVIKPLFNPSITKRQVDRFCIFHNDIPKCEFSMQRSKESSPAQLMHRIDLKEGTANGKDHFFISFNPPPISSSLSDHHYSALERTSADTRTLAISGSEQAEGHPDMIMTQQGCQLDEHSVGTLLRDLPKRHLIDLGLALGLNYVKLHGLRSTENFCTEVVSAWLREEDKVSEGSGKPSWESLAKALEEIGQNGIARTVREKYHCY